MVVHPKSESYGLINYTHRVGYFVFIHLKYVPYSGKKIHPSTTLDKPTQFCFSPRETDQLYLLGGTFCGKIDTVVFGSIRS